MILFIKMAHMIFFCECKAEKYFLIIQTNNKIFFTTSPFNYQKCASFNFISATNSTAFLLFGAGRGLPEASRAYKDSDAVMGAQTELVEVVGRFQPRIVRMD